MAPLYTVFLNTLLYFYERPAVCVYARVCCVPPCPRAHIVFMRALLCFPQKPRTDNTWLRVNVKPQLRTRN